MKIERIYGKRRRWHVSAWQLWSADERKRQNVNFHWLHVALSICGTSASAHLTILGCGLYVSTYTRVA